MGRPLNSRYFGLISGTNQVISVTAWTPGDTQSRIGSIVKQVSSNGYLVTTAAAGGGTGVCYLVNSASPSASGQMSIAVFPYGESQTGSGGSATAQMGVLAAPTIAAAGSNYKVADTVTLGDNGTGTHAIYTVGSVNGTGGIAAVTLSNTGTYTTLPSSLTGISTTTSGTGAGATLTITNFQVVQGTVTAAGTDYIAATATFSSGSATATVTVNGSTGGISALTITNGGTYTTIPTITIGTSGAGTTEYAANLQSNLVYTFADNVYKWVLQPNGIGPGQAEIDSNQ